LADSASFSILIKGGVQPSVFSSFERLKSVVIGTNGLFAGLAGKLAGVFSGVQLLRFAAHAISATDELSKFSDEVGIAVDKLSKLQFAADLANVGDVFKQGMRKFSTTIAQAQEQGSKADQVFRSIGVSVMDLNGQLRATDEILLEVADKFNSWENGASKARIAQELFGTRQSRFINLLNEGRAGLQAQGDELQRIGVVTPEAAASSSSSCDLPSWINNGPTPPEGFSPCGTHLFSTGNCSIGAAGLGAPPTGDRPYLVIAGQTALDRIGKGQNGGGAEEQADYRQQLSNRLRGR